MLKRHKQQWQSTTTTWIDDNVKKKLGDLGWGEVENERMEERAGREGGNISGQLPTLTLRRSYEFLYYYCFYSIRIFLLFAPKRMP